MYSRGRGNVITLVPKLRFLLKKAREDRVSAFAAQSAFFSLMALFPFVILFVWVMSFFPFAAEYAKGALQNVLPSLMGDFIESALGTSTAFNVSGSVTLITFFTALWSSSRAVYSIICGLNSVCRVDETRSYLRLRLCAAVYTLIFVFILAFSVFLIFAGKGADSILSALFPEAEWLFLLINMRFILSAVLLTCLFLLMFSYLPCKREKLRSRLPGAVTAAVAWLLFSRIFSFYAFEIADFSRLYGSLATVALIMLWFYFSMYILFIAAELNEMMER